MITAISSFKQNGMNVNSSKVNKSKVNFTSNLAKDFPEAVAMAERYGIKLVGDETIASLMTKIESSIKELHAPTPQKTSSYRSSSSSRPWWCCR